MEKKNYTQVKKLVDLQLETRLKTSRYFFVECCLQPYLIEKKKATRSVLNSYLKTSGLLNHINFVYGCDNIKQFVLITKKFTKNSFIIYIKIKYLHYNNLLIFFKYSFYYLIVLRKFNLILKKKLSSSIG